MTGISDIARTSSWPHGDGSGRSSACNSLVYWLSLLLTFTGQCAKPARSGVGNDLRLWLWMTQSPVPIALFKSQSVCVVSIFPSLLSACDLDSPAYTRTHCTHKHQTETRRRTSTILLLCGKCCTAYAFDQHDQHRTCECCIVCRLQDKQCPHGCHLFVCVVLCRITICCQEIYLLFSLPCCGS